MRAEIGDRDISIVVNNVGVNCIGRQKDGVYLENLTSREISNFIRVNTFAQTLLHFHFKRPMQERGTRSAFIDVSSIGNYIYYPKYISVYQSTKKYNHYMLNSFALTGGPKLDFLCVMPGWFKTNIMAGCVIDPKRFWRKIKRV